VLLGHKLLSSINPSLKVNSREKIENMENINRSSKRLIEGMMY
jgi:hypothetical protein